MAQQKIIDYSVIASYEEKRKSQSTTSREVIFYEYATLIQALFELNWTHRDILQFLYEHELKDLIQSKKIANKTLGTYRLGWLKAEMIDLKAVAEEVAKLKEVFGDKVQMRKPRVAKPVASSGITIMGAGGYNVLTLGKSLRSKGVIISDEAVKNLYEENKEKTLDKVVADYIKSLDNRNSQ